MVCDLCTKAYDSVAIKINNAHICRECEEKIIAVTVWDPEYQMWINRIKRFWQHLLGEKGYA